MMRFARLYEDLTNVARIYRPLRFRSSEPSVSPPIHAITDIVSEDFTLLSLSLYLVLD